MNPTASARLLTGLLAGAGTLHLVTPQVFDRIVPRALPGGPRLYTVTSGVAELGIAALLARRQTRPVGGAAATALFVAVFPANVTMARAWRSKSWPLRAIAYGRLPLQAVLIGQAVQVARSGVRR